MNRVRSVGLPSGLRSMLGQESPSIFIKLDNVGIRGNGHMMMLGKNNHEITEMMIDWLEKSVK